MTLRWYFLRWLCSVVDLASGLVGTLTLGFFTPGMLVLRTQSLFLDYSDEYLMAKAKVAGGPPPRDDDDGNEDGH